MIAFVRLDEHRSEFGLLFWEANSAHYSSPILRSPEVQFHRPTDRQLLVLVVGKGWTASDSDFDQAIIVDLGNTMRVTAIETQGRPHSSEYTMEYAIGYGLNGYDFAMYKEPGGDTKV
ncbi:Hypothetical protein NTJ_08159 [Nesidiocoris tenuis]|uniref:F5/8 type C domain-containing protein n=1 Tax=Nesidiocoris tenuis TaxID=355587 RepID=A0ABN7AT14_9HEMI|nr:Hypothetical protein NTJ_08159 [Nesidiocoris tenuis]